MNKPQKVVFYGSESANAKALAAAFRAQGFGAVVRSALAFAGEREPGELVLMPCVQAHHARRISRVYGTVDPMEKPRAAPAGVPDPVRPARTLTLARRNRG